MKICSSCGERNWIFEYKNKRPICNACGKYIDDHVENKIPKGNGIVQGGYRRVKVPDSDEL